MPHQTSFAAAAILVALTAAMGTSSLAQVSFGEDSPAPYWRLSETGTNVSLRGLSAVDDDVIWASGAAATVIRSID
ncbi:MAG: oxidoreductase, partial [Rhodopirellula bahusiensis]